MVKRTMKRGTVVLLLIGGCGGGGSGGGPTVDEAIQACVTFGSCSGEGINFCFQRDLPVMTADEIRCFAGARGCAQAAACTFEGVSFRPGIQPPCTQSGPKLCDGDTRIECRSSEGAVQTPVTIATDCKHADTASTCMVSPTDPSYTDCAIGTCTADMGSCDGTRAINCYTANGLLLASDCALQRPAQACMVGVNMPGVAECVGAGPACTASGNHCDGADLVGCYYGREMRTHCNVVAGESCRSVMGSSFCGSGTECQVTSMPATCSGTRLAVCAGGLNRTIDCLAAGFQTCTDRGICI
jgi:hypothetical protein